MEEPGRLRENPPGSGEPEAGEWKEKRPGVDPEEERKRSGGSAASQAGCAHPGEVKDETPCGEDEEDQYEDEELDPRIQVIINLLLFLLLLYSRHFKYSIQWNK